MKKLNKEEAGKILKSGRGKISPVVQQMLALEIDEAIILERNEWNGKKAPHYLVYSAIKKYNRNFSCKLLADGSGWIIQRLKVIT